MNNANWSREELIVAFNLYCKTTFSAINSRNKTIIETAKLIHRSASAVALKLANFARLDPDLKQRHIAGMRHGSKAEVDIWNEFNNDWEELAYKSELILANMRNKPIEQTTDLDFDDLHRSGIERDSIVKTRVNQYFFRRTVLASYNGKCCMTGISVPELLVAGHIIPWAIDEKKRMDPHNGVCLNGLHHQAFDLGLITITPEYLVKVSRRLLENKGLDKAFFTRYNGTKIELPQRFVPSRDLLEYHNRNTFLDRVN